MESYEKQLIAMPLYRITEINRVVYALIHTKIEKSVWRHMSIFNAGPPAEMIFEGSRWPLEHLTTTVAAQLVLPAVRAYMLTYEKCLQLVPSEWADETPIHNNHWAQRRKAEC